MQTWYRAFYRHMLCILHVLVYHLLHIFDVCANLVSCLLQAHALHFACLGVPSPPYLPVGAIVSLPMQDAAAGRSLAALLLLDPAALGLLQSCARASLAPRASGLQAWGSRAASPLPGPGSGQAVLSPHASGMPAAGCRAGSPVPGSETGPGLETGPAPLVCALGVRLALLDAYAAAARLLGRLPDITQVASQFSCCIIPHSAQSQQMCFR